MSVDRRIQRGATTRARLVETARERFGRDGFERTSIEAILQDSGVARGALYHHFPTKEALFDAVLEQVVADVAARIADAARTAPDPAGALRAGCDRWLRLAQDSAIRQIVLVDAPAVVGWARWRQLDEQHTLGGVRASLWRLARAGRIPKSDVDVLANMVLAAVSEAAMVTVGADNPKRALRQAKDAVRTLIDRLVGPDHIDVVKP
jgi:AcrR family transcriptional regulator